MRFKAAIAIILIGYATAPVSAADKALRNCPFGSLGERDFAKGQVELDDEHVVKIRLEDQHGMTVLSKGKSYFSATASDISRYHLKNEAGQRWLVATTAGLFGGDARQARTYYSLHANISASYFPATRKVVVSSAVPGRMQTRTYRFWVFVKVPAHATTITYGCSSFE